MVSVDKNIGIETATKANISWGDSQVKELINGPMGQSIKANSSMDFVTAVDSGSPTQKERAILIKESTLKTKSPGLDDTSGKMDQPTKVAS